MWAHNAEATAVAAFDALPLEERQAILVREMKGTGDPDFACFNLGLPYHHLDEMAKALPSIKE